MAYDPRREDYQRLGLRFAKTLDGSPADSAARAFASFGRRFAQSRDSLPQTDADRAFHLVALATDLIDYQLPFASDDAAEGLISRGRRLLSEALAIDPGCHDARRMSAAGSKPSFEEYYSFLRAGADEVLASCTEQLALARSEMSGDRIGLAEDIAMRPYRRWIAAASELALICGHNREALRLGEQLLENDPEDLSDVRYTMALALAKLEDEPGLDELESRLERTRGNAWSCLARTALAHKRRDYGAAREHLSRIIKRYPEAVSALIRQSELPDGVFSRLAVTPFSEDELILAISEATVLLQEGFERSGRGVLGLWVADAVAEMHPHAAALALAERDGTDR